MRILFTVNPEATIFRYLVPMAWALRTAGHDVRFASQPGFTKLITQAGLTAVPVGRDSSPWRVLARSPETIAAMRAGLLAPYDAFDDPTKDTWEYLRPGMTAAVDTWHRASSFPMVASLVEFARSWKPDLVVWEPLTHAGPIAAKACGAAHARLLFGIDVLGGVRQRYLELRDQQPAGQRDDPLLDWFASYGRKYGFAATEDMTCGQFTIDQFPASLAIDAKGLHYLRTQHIPYGGPAVVPQWLWRRPERPRVALTMGLSATDVYSGYVVSILDILEAMADLDIEIVATISDEEQRRIGRFPANTRVASYVPWHALAPTCSAVVHHAGAATMATTARFAVPQLSLHYHWDQPILARLLTEQGAGLAIGASDVTGDNVSASVLRLLNEPVFAERATALRDEIHALPSPNQIVGDIETLIARHQDTTG